MPARKTPKRTTAKRAQKRTTSKRKDKSAKHVRTLLAEARKSKDHLVAAGIDRDRLERRLGEIERHLEAEHHDPAELHSILSELRADFIEIENRLIGSGVLQILHQILGTGVPSPR